MAAMRPDPRCQARAGTCHDATGWRVMTEKALTKKLSGTRELMGAPKARIVIADPPPATTDRPHWQTEAPLVRGFFAARGGRIKRESRSALLTGDHLA
jgi:hypothetical protein